MKYLIVLLVLASFNVFAEDSSSEGVSYGQVDVDKCEPKIDTNRSPDSEGESKDTPAENSGSI